MATEQIGLPQEIQTIDDSARANRLVLLAEPDDQRRVAYTAALQDAGYHVTAVADVGVVFEEATRQRPDLIVIRLAESRTEGFEMCHRIRAGADTRDTPVIVLTRLDDSYIREQVVRAGGTAILTEPLKLTLLLRQARRLLARAKPRTA